MSAEQLITKHLDIWTSAHKTRGSAGRGSSSKLDLYGIKKLRELILELAVRGKLVPQDPNDEPASELLKKIENEKKKLLAEGKIKKEKALPKISPEEILSELPFNWCWTQLGLITNYGTTTKVDSIESDCWVLDLEDIEKDTSKLIQKVRFSERASLSDKNSFSRGDVLYGKLRPYLNKVIVADEDGVCTTEILPIRPYIKLNSEYLKIVLKSPSFLNYVNDRSYGMKMPRLGTDDGRKATVPLAPLAEQHRIVSKVNELMAFCDELEQAQTNNIAAHSQLVEALLTTLTNSKDHQELQANWQRIAEHFDTLFITEDSIDQLKQTILQLAVMGKIVPQDPNDEPASELLIKINNDLCKKTGQNQLIKLERDKSTTDPASFHWSIPNNWIWCELQDIALFANGKAHEQYVVENSDYILVNSSFVSNSGDKVKFVSERLSPLEKGDFAIVMSDVPNGRALARCYIVEADNKYTLNQRIGSLYFPELISRSYLYNVINRSKYLLSYDDGKKQTNLKKVQILSCPIPLPSLNEQYRIAARVDFLINLCGSLRMALNEKSSIEYKFVEALTESL